MKRVIAAAAFAASIATAHAATFSGPLAYLQASDNPLGAGSLLYSYLETFEDGVFDTPGVLVSAGTLVNGPARATDSVDADDGATDGSGQAGRSLYSGTATLHTLTFSNAILGTLPTRVGLVFTDVGQVLPGSNFASGFGLAYLEVFDGGGVSQGFSSFAFGDGSVTGETAEDRFLGATYAGGIGSVVFGFQNSIDWEVDHVFYAATAASGVPEPASLALAAPLALLALARRRRGSSAR